jgi:hypothetical protein
MLSGVQIEDQQSGKATIRRGDDTLADHNVFGMDQIGIAGFHRVEGHDETIDEAAVETLRRDVRPVFRECQE